MGATASSAVKGVAKATAKSLPKVIKGVKSGGVRAIKGVKRSGSRIVKGIKGMVGGRPRGVMKESIIQRGTRPIKEMKILGKFDETLQTGLPAIRDIPKTGFVKQTLSKAQRLKMAKQSIRNI